MRDYERCVRFWDKTYQAEEPLIPSAPEMGIPDLDGALDWLCDGADTVLDFGCGNGLTLMTCALRGVRSLVGVDLSAEGIRLARARASRMTCGQYAFYHGSVETLESLPDSSFDGIILMNILDNLYPQDGEALLATCARLLKPGGRALITLNSHLSPEQIANWHIRVIEGDLLDDGLLLNNLTDARWLEAIGQHLDTSPIEPLRYPEASRPGRLLRASKPHQIPTGGTS